MLRENRVEFRFGRSIALAFRERSDGPWLIVRLRAFDLRREPEFTDGVLWQLNITRGEEVLDEPEFVMSARSRGVWCDVGELRIELSRVR